MNLRLFILIFSWAILSSCSEDDTINQPAPEDYPEIVNGTFEFQGNQRIYVLHIPDSFDGTQAAPLVVFLHGGNGNAQSAQNFTNFNETSEENGFLMLYPQAWFESQPNSFVWADGRGLAPDNLGIDDVGFVNSLVNQLKTEYNINENKIYLCGFSNGSFLTQEIAFQDNSQFAAIGTIGGTMNQDLYNNGNPNRAIPMIYIFGTDDPLVPYEGGYVSGNTNFDPVVGAETAVDFWVNNNNCQTTLPIVEVANTIDNDNSTVSIFEYTDGNQNSKVKFYQINGGGHTWPGVPLPNQNLGNVNMDIEASTEIWDFLNQFTR
jgi:polyhydroxybutyrate depolymerase